MQVTWKKIKDMLQRKIVMYLPTVEPWPISWQPVILLPELHGLQA
jgi:hypothetical protein